MAFSSLLDYWPLVAAVGFLAALGFMRIIANDVQRRIERHDQACQTAQAKCDHLRHRREQLRRQRELMDKN